jgi:uncharacterized protein YgiM (DUF1202 family)
VVGGVCLVALLGSSVWVATRVFGPDPALQKQSLEQQGDTLLFDYAISTDVNRLRVSGTANVPNGAILVGTLDKIGLGPLEVKEALVMNRIFAMDFGPELFVQYPWLGQIEALTAGTYRISIEFDPVQQSPFVRESLRQRTLKPSASTNKDTIREGDSAIVRAAETFAIGSREEQQEAAAKDQQYRQTIRHHLDETMQALTGLWQRLRTQYVQDHTQGGFLRTDPRATAWQDWSAQWLHELRTLGEQQRLHETSSSPAPYRLLRDALVTAYQQMIRIVDVYFEVVVNERSPNDPELQWAEQQLHASFGDASALLGHLLGPPPSVGKPDDGPSTVVVISPVVNVRTGPGMHYEVLGQVKKDDILAFLGEQGEWFQIKLSDTRVGWLHRSVASKTASATGPTAAITRTNSKQAFWQRITPLKLEPIALRATPVDHIPRPTADEFRIYAEVEQQLRDLPAGGSIERQLAEQHILQRLSEKYGVSPGLMWSTYLKVQGWEVRQ